ncbi:MAG: hypothetical protein A2001_13920 [Treponema sp. GWC1_61_84]|nr:MAG: hypothetical protein A2001_13920 [Treponema sp. GWC1_61_84]
MKKTNPTVYNIHDVKHTKIYISKRINKTGLFFVCAALDPLTGKSGKSFVIRPETFDDGTPILPPYGKKVIAAARQVAERLAQEHLTTVPDKHTDLEAFLLESVWKEDSPYFKKRADDGHVVTVSYVRMCRRVLELYFLPWSRERGVKSIAQFTKPLADEWRAWARTKAEKAGFRYHSTVNMAFSALKIAFDDAVELELVPVNVMTLFKTRRIKEAKSVKAVFSDDEIQRILAANWEDPRAEAAFMLAVTTGMRLAEITGLRRDCVFSEKGTIDVKWQFAESDNRRLCKPKCGKERLDVPIPDEVLKAMDKLKFKRKSPYVFYGTNDSEPIKVNLIYKYFYMAIESAGVERGKRTFHSLRHYYAKKLRQAVGLDLASAIIGHATVAMTKEYDTVDARDLAQVRDATANILQFKKAVGS